jgi:uncharacterized membrane protein YqaE (UPF0057 family)
MSKYLFFACLAATVTLFAGCSSQKPLGPHEAKPSLTAVQFDKLVTIRSNVELIEKLRQQGVEVDAEGRVKESLLKEASDLTDGTIRDWEFVVSATGAENAPPTKWDQMKGLFTFVNIMIVMGAVIAGTGIIWLFGHYFWTLILAVPAEAWEVILWAGFALLAWSASLVSTDWQLAVLMPACVGFFGAMSLTCFVHGSKSKSYEIPSLVLTVVYGTVALFFGSHVVGFMSVMALLNALGFMMGHIPGCVYLGWDNDSQVARGTFAAGLMLTLHILFTLTGAAVVLAPFREGMLFMGSFVYFVGLLIMSSRYYWYSYTDKDGKLTDFGYRTNWVAFTVMQVCVLSSALLAFYFGSVYNMPALLGFSGTVFAIYVLEKYYDLPWKGVGWAWSMLGLGGLLYGLGLVVQSYPQYFLLGF